MREQGRKPNCHKRRGLSWNFTLDRLTRKPDVEPAEFQQASHDEAWGCAHSRVWRVYVDLGERQEVQP